MTKQELEQFKTNVLVIIAQLEQYSNDGIFHEYLRVLGELTNKLELNDTITVN